MSQLHLYSGIDDSTVTEAKNFLAANVGKPIGVRINSPGGSVFAGMTIYQLLKDHGAKVTTTVDGIAASIASIIFLAGSERHISTGGMLMVHSASLATRGNARQLVKDAATLGKVDESLTNIYTAATKQPREKITAMMETETWLTSSEAVALGFAHKLTTSAKIAASWDAKSFPQIPIAARLAAGINPTTRKAMSATIDHLKSEVAKSDSRLTATDSRMLAQMLRPSMATIANRTAVIAELASRGITYDEKSGIVSKSKQSH